MEAHEIRRRLGDRWKSEWRDRVEGWSEKENEEKEKKEKKEKEM